MIALYLIYSHAILGGIALLSGTISAFSQKGSKLHKKTGAIFHNTMVLSIILSFIISVMPEHENPFLFAIGVFSLYLVISGKRCLKTKKPNFNIQIDRYLAIGILVIGIAMILLPMITYTQINVILSVFGVIAIIMGINDFRALNSLENYKKNRFIIHIGKITGGYIAAITAFIVVNHILPGYWAWFTPTVLGMPYIIYYTRKEKAKMIV